MICVKVWSIEGDAMRKVRNGLHREPVRASIAAPTMEDAVELFRSFVKDTERIAMLQVTLMMSDVWA